MELVGEVATEEVADIGLYWLYAEKYYCSYAGWIWKNAYRGNGLRKNEIAQLRAHVSISSSQSSFSIPAFLGHSKIYKFKSSKNVWIN